MLRVVISLAEVRRAPAGGNGRSGPGARGQGRGKRAKGRNPSAMGFAAWLAEALVAVLALEAPADQTLRAFFRRNKHLGQRDRGLIADRCFDILRQRRLYGHLAESGHGPIERRLALLADQNAPHQALSVTPDESQWLDHIAKIDKQSLPDRVRLSMPDWLADPLLERLGAAELAALAAHLLSPAALDLRANLFKTTPAALLAELAADGMPAVSLSAERAWLPETALRLAGHPTLEKSAQFLSGHFEVQDAGSQLIAKIAAPKRGDTVVDFCAGAGGKTLAMAALMRSRGQIYACDTSQRRLARMTPRLARSGVSNVQPLWLDSEHDPRLRRLAKRADVVLVDAPCSGSGTLRRNPDLKWRHDQSDVKRLVVQQLSILQAAAALVKPGGRLIYATCSLLEDENEAIAHQFEAALPVFVRIDLSEQTDLTCHSCGGEPEGSVRPAITAENVGFLRLWPHIDDTDGFFVAAWALPKS